MAIVVVAAARGEHAQADALPKIGAFSEIEDIGCRLGDPDSGSAISYANGGSQVSYDTIPEIHRSRVGDLVKLCLVSLPEGLPAWRRPRHGL